MSLISIGAAGLILTLDVIASLFVLFSNSHTGPQKLLQLLLIWVIPLLGGTVVLAFVVEDRRANKVLSRDNFDPPENPPGIGMTGGP